MFIVIAGPDGSGKSTVSRLVRDALMTHGEVHHRDKWDIFDHATHPACRFLRGTLPELRSCISAMPVPARTTFLFWTFHMTMRAEMLPAQGWTVVDSYWYKHGASEILYGAPHELISALSANLPRPDRVYLLDVSPAEAWRRKEDTGLVDVVPYECGMSTPPARDAFVAHQARLRRQLLDWADRHEWTVMNGALPPRQLAAAIADGLRDMPRTSSNHVEG